MIATDAVKSDFPALGIVETAVPAVVVNPQKSEYAQNEQAVENDIEGEIRRMNHDRELIGTGGQRQGEIKTRRPCGTARCK
jgi:hypothetical protein